MLYFATPILGATVLAVVIPFLIAFFQNPDDDTEPDEAASSNPTSRAERS